MADRLTPVPPPPDAPASPPVVAVVVTKDPGPWFDETMRALAAQDYPTMAVLVLDNASQDDPTPRVAEHLPDAIVRRLAADEGYGRAANRVRELVDGAAYLLFVHDDVSPGRTATSIMVAEAIRNNAGVVGPKLVQWNDVRRLLGVGASADRTGVLAPLVEPGELDQEQHDRVRDVFVVPGAYTLVRADLFEALGGFDPDISYLGEDLDLCWRAHSAGARVLVAPEAIVRHLEALGERRPVEARRRLINRHRVRSLLGNTSRAGLVRSVPVALLLAVAEALYALVTGRFRQARDVMGAWTWNLSRLRSLRRKRAGVSAVRQVGDRELAHLQVAGSARLRSFLRGQLRRGDRLSNMTEASRELAATLTSGPARVAMATWAIVLVALGFAARHLLTRGVPAVGDFLAWPGGDVLREAYLDRWRPLGLGEGSALPTSLGAWGLADLAPGSPDLLRRLVILGVVPLGLLGAWRLVRPFGSRLAASAGVVVMAVAPPLVAGVSAASWPLLAVAGAAPWLLAGVARVVGLDPFGGASTERSTIGEMASLALVVAVAGLLHPLALIVAPLYAVVLVLAAPLAGGLGASTVGLIRVLVATAVGWLVHLPWILGVLDEPASLWVGVGGRTLLGSDTVYLEVLRLELGPLGSSWWGWAFPILAVVSVMLARDQRLAWSVRSVVLVTVSSVAAWALAREAGSGYDWPDAATVLALATPGYVVAAAVAVVAVERDLPAARFGWRQSLVLMGSMAAVAACLPLAGLLPDGRLEMTNTGVSAAVGFVDGDHRVLWLGSEASLPVAGVAVDTGTAGPVSMAVTTGLPDLLVGEYRGRSPALEPVAQVLAAVAEGRSVRLGRLLAPAGVRYLVVVRSSLPVFAGGQEPSEGEPIEAVLADQLDLRLVPADPSVVVFENVSALPIDAVLDERGEAVALDDAALLDELELGEARPLGDELDPGESVYTARRPLSRWTLEVDGVDQSAVPVFGMGELNRGTPGGRADVVLERPDGWNLVVLAQLVGWLALVAINVRRPDRGLGS